MEKKTLSDWTDEELDKELLKSQHKELVVLLRQLLTVTKDDKGKDAAVVKLIQEISGEKSIFLDKLKQVAAPQVPNVNVTSDNTEVAKNIKLLMDKDDKIIGLLQQLIELRSAEVEMIPKRGGYNGTGLIEKVLVKTILPGKSKYQA